MNGLIVYASTHGHTAKIAQRIGDGLYARGIVARVVDVEQSADVDPEEYDVVVIGSSIHRGHHRNGVGLWARSHGASFPPGATAVFSVSLAAAEGNEEAQAATAEYLAELIDITGLAPSCTASFAGALEYREYDVWTRVLIRLIARHKGMSTDTDVDHDYTDWAAVDAFAEQVAALALTASRA